MLTATAQKLDHARADAGSDATSERRGGPRTITIYRVGRLTSDDDAGLCRLHDISDQGAMVMTRLVTGIGDAVTLSVSDSVHLAGSVVWTDGARLGITFAEPIDAAGLLKSLAAARRAGSERPTRLATDTVAAAVTPYGTGAVTVRNVSQQGMQVVHDGSFKVGLPVKIILENGLERRGIVRWTEEKVAGLKLLEPIGYHELERASRL